MPHTPGHPAFPFENFLPELLEAQPQIPFFGAVSQAARTPVQRRFFQSQFQPIFNQFQGTLAQNPGGRFTDFLKASPFIQRFRSLPPSLRGGGFRSRFAPRARTLFNF